VFRQKIDPTRPSKLEVYHDKRKKHTQQIIGTSMSRSSEDAEGWFAIELKVSQILRHPKKSLSSTDMLIRLQTIMKCENCEFSSKKKYKPYLILKTVSHIREMSRRSTEESCTGGCCRKSLKINFKDFGWDFVYYPREYDAYYCKGDCAGIAGNASAVQHKHTGLVEAVSQKNKTDIPFCCAPKKFSALNMMYMRGGSLIRRNVEDMIVEECWCI